MPRRRWRIGVLLGVGVLVNYLDRINLSVAAPQIEAEFHLGAAQTGLYLSAFFWPYALLQIPAGALLDRVGPTWLGRWGALLWGVASAATAVSTGFIGIFAARLLLGVAEAPSFLVSSKATGFWFPRAERALATALFDAAAKFANVIGVPLVALVLAFAGWRWSFVVTALLSVAYFIGFLLVYRDPSADKGLSDVERRHILSGGSSPEGAAGLGSLKMLGCLLSHRKVWAILIGFAAYGYAFYLFLTWLPSYLEQTMHMGILKSAGYTAIPWSVATATDLVVGGWLIDHLIARGGNESRIRKTVLVSGMLCGLSVFGATQTQDANWATVWISIALGGLAAAAPVCWSLPSLIAPKGGVGALSGLMNFANNAMGGAAAFVTGLLVSATHSFTNAFLVAGVVLLIGLASFVFLLGDITPLTVAVRPSGEAQA